VLYGIYQSAAGLQVNQYRQEILANNLANAETTGFKHDLAVVRERPVASQEDRADPMSTHPIYDRLTGGSLVAPTYTLFTQGPIEHTGNNLDVAISGDGFFTVQDGDAVRYTRDGRFMLNADGELVTAGNHKVLSEAGQPIVIPSTAAKQLEITPAGELRAGSVVFGKLGLVDFEDKRQLRKIGRNLLAATDTEPTPVKATLRPQCVEGSTVDPMTTMVEMIEASRAYQMNATLVGLADSTLGRAVNDIARIR
jgi:flagellar basal body rod protein FlgG